MRKIVKRTVSTVLALAMSASMAVGMSSTASAATSTTPYKVSGLSWTNWSTQSNGMTSLTLNWNKTDNAKGYFVEFVEMQRINGKEYCKNTSYYFRTLQGANNTSWTFNNLPGVVGKGFTKSFDISVTPFNGNTWGEKTHLYDLKDFTTSINYVPCINDVDKDTIKYSNTKDTLTFTWKDSDVVDHSTQGTQITLTDTTTNKKIIRTTSSKSYTFKKLTPGHKYKAEFRSFVIGYAGKIIFDAEKTPYDKTITLPTK